MNEDFIKSLNLVKAALEERGASAITGGQVNALIKEVAPSLDVRSVVDIPSPKPGALTVFIERYLGDKLAHIGMNGGDKLYGINGFLGGYESSKNVGGIWKSFVSTESQFSLVIDNSTHRLKSIPTDAINPEVTAIPKVTLAEHGEIREEFHQEFDDDLRDAFGDPPKPTDDFEDWIEQVKEKPPLFRKWGIFRKDKILSLFEERLMGLGLQDEEIPSLVRFLSRSQKAINDRSEKDKNLRGESSQRHIATIQLGGQSGHASIARIASASIQEMSEEQVRALQLPLGAVFDAIRKM